MATIAFDVYGTLIDTNGVVDRLREWIGSQAEVFSQTWRSKQLEYSFRRGLSRNLRGLYSSCAGLLLCRIRRFVFFGTERHFAAKLSQFACVCRRRRERCRLTRLFAFSNGTSEAVKEILHANGLLERFEGVVSCDALKTFKPNPDVYHYFMSEAGDSNDAWLISGNPFDVIGAVSAGILDPTERSLIRESNPPLPSKA